MNATRRLRVLLASTSYPSHAGDWRGVFIRNMTFALAARPGIDLAAWCPPGPLPSNVRDAATEADRRWLGELAEAGGIAHALRRARPSGFIAAMRLMTKLRALYGREQHTDVVHANWLQVALPLWNSDTPLVATVLGTDYRLLSLPGMTAGLRRVFRQRRTALCPNAGWMVPGLEKRFGDVARIVPVPFGVDAGYFRIDRRPVAPARWICVSRLTRAKIGDLLGWGESCFAGRQRELHLLGPMQESMALPDWVHYHGPASQADLLERWFPEATGLISLSRHPEGRPQVMLEAMAAGLPIVASDLPAHLELVAEGEAGLICHSSGELEAALSTVESTEGAGIGARARANARAQYGSWEDCALRYEAIYRELTA